MYVYIYIYVYICVCVCECVCVFLQKVCICRLRSVQDNGNLTKSYQLYQSLTRNKSF